MGPTMFSEALAVKMARVNVVNDPRLWPQPQTNCRSRQRRIRYVVGRGFPSHSPGLVQPGLCDGGCVTRPSEFGALDLGYFGCISLCFGFGKLLGCIICRMRNHHSATRLPNCFGPIGALPFSNELLDHFL